MRRGPSALELREQALDHLDDDPAQARALAERAARLLPDAESYYVLGLACGAEGDSDGAIAAHARALEDDPEHEDARAALGLELFDLLRFDEAGEQASIVLHKNATHPTARHLRGCLRERRGDEDGAARDFMAASLSDPDGYPLPVRLSDEDVEQLVGEVIASLHPSLRRYLDDVPVILEEVPPEDVLRELEPPGRPTELLGCFSGPTLAERNSPTPWTTLPSTISLYRRNLERLAQDHDDLIAELRVTLLHEIGHFLGLDEDDLAARGLD